MISSITNYRTQPKANEELQNQGSFYQDTYNHFSGPLLTNRRSDNKVQSRQFFKKSLLCGVSPEKESSSLFKGSKFPQCPKITGKKGLPSQIYYSHLQPHASPRKQKFREQPYQVMVKEVCAPSTVPLRITRECGSLSKHLKVNRILPSSDVFETNSSLSFERTSSLLTNSSTPHSDFSSSFSQHEEATATQECTSQNYGILAAGFHQSTRTEDVSVFQITPPLYQPHSPRKRDESCLTPRKTSKKFLQQVLLSTRDFLLPKVIQKYTEENFEPRLLKTEEKTQCYLEVSASTVATALTEGSINLLIVDCRFDYEYQGGHISGALNISSPYMLQKELLHCEEKANQRFEGKTAIIFHCEFSSKRAPAMFTMMRDLDRKVVGIQNYPELLMPEMYVLKGGYSKFYHQYPQLCEGLSGYTPMTAYKPKDETQTMGCFEENQMLYQQDIKKMF